MERPLRKFTVSLGTNQHPVVTFEGDYINKKELDLCIRALKKKQREIISNYRKKQIIADYEARKKGLVNSDGQSRTSESSKGSRGTEGKGRSADGTKTTTATGVGGSAPAGSTGVSGLAGKVPGVTGAANPSVKSTS